MARDSISVEGRVVSVDAAGSLLDFPRASACGSCVAQNSCGSHLLETSGNHQLQLSVPAAPGQRVSLSVPARQFLGYVAIAYLLIPLLAFTGASVAFLSLGGDLAAASGALFGGWVGYGLVKLYDSQRVERPEAVIVGAEGSEH